MKFPQVSRKFAIVIIYLIMQGIVAFAPESISAKVEQFAPIAAVVACVGIGGITVEDSVKLWAARPGSVRDALQEVLDEVFPQALVPPSAQQPSNTVVNVGTTPDIAKVVNLSAPRPDAIGN